MKNVIGMIESLILPSNVVLEFLPKNALWGTQLEFIKKKKKEI